MTQYTITTTDSDDSFVTLTGVDVQSFLEARVQELVGQGQQMQANAVAQAYLNADPTSKDQIDSAVAAIQEELAKQAVPADPAPDQEIKP